MARVERDDAIPWRPKPSDIPTQPGVYRFRDGSGRVLYVGKAINLRQRLANYFQPLQALHQRTRHMVLMARDVDWTVVGSDIEALQLEYTWIKSYEPPFNVKFRDDKTYPSMAVTLADEAPRVMVTRNRKIRGARYFGPYPKVWAVKETIDLMIRAFPIRTCSDSSYAQAMATGRPCFPGQIGRCGGPCSGRVTIEEHRRIVDDFVAFMASHDRSVITHLEREMKAASAELDFESAARLRDRIQALENVLDRSAVVLADGLDLDVFGIAHDELAAAVQQYAVRGGRIRGTRTWVVDTELNMDLAELVDSVVETAYETLEPPREILVPELPDDVDALGEWLTERRRSAGASGRVEVRHPQRGDKAAVLRTATLNAGQELVRYKSKRTADYVARTQALTDLQEALELDEAPLRIECYDVSHLSGTDIVASMVVFEDGIPKKSDYRKFSVPEYADDTAAMAQVLRRRLAYVVDEESSGALDAQIESESLAASPEGAEEGLESASAPDVADGDATVASKRRRFAYRPGLILVDGGQPQVAAVQRVLDELGIDDIPLAGLAKRLEEVWRPGEDFPVILPRQSEALFLLQRLRDEAHRFAITFQRAKRSSGIRSQLESLPGLGPSRVKELLKHFGSVARLRAATPDEIAEVRGIGPALAASIAARLGTPDVPSRPEPEEEDA